MGPRKRVARGRAGGGGKRRRLETESDSDDATLHHDADPALEVEDRGLLVRGEVPVEGGVEPAGDVEELEAGEEEEDEFAQRYPRASPALLGELKALHELLPANLEEVVDNPDHDRARPAATEILHGRGMPLYELQHSLHLCRLLDNPDILAEHQKLDVSGRGVFPVRVPCPALSVSDADWSGLPLCSPIVAPHLDSSVYIESMFQALSTGQAVREFRALLRQVGLVPGCPAPRYRQDLVSVDPHRIEAGWLRTLQQWSTGGGDDLLSVFLDDDRRLSELRECVERFNADLDRIVPFFHMGIAASVEVAGDLLESAGKQLFFLFCTYD